MQDGALLDAYAGLICDLDGVVYRGSQAVPGAVETLNTALDRGVGLAFATNNASRPPEVAADQLRALGVAGEGWSVVNSAQAAASYIADRFGPGAAVLAVGGSGVTAALTDRGLHPVRLAELSAGRELTAVVQGMGADVTWRELAEVAYRAAAGLPWVVTNIDRTLPTDRGVAPGNGTLVGVVRAATDAEPIVVGKPGPALFELSRAEIGTDPERTLVCGDRLDTDIAGANAAGLDSLFVLSGAHSLADLAEAPPEQRPTYVGADLTALLAPAQLS